MANNKELHKKMSKRLKKQKKQPGKEFKMKPKPKTDDAKYEGSNKLKNKIAIITGGDSGIGHAVAIFFAKEGADLVITYLNEHKDARQVQREVEELGRRCILIAGDVGKESFCNKVIKKTIKEFGKVDILVNNAAEQHTQKSIEDISEKQLVKTFRTNIFSYFFMIKLALPYMKKGSSIINTTSVTAYKGNDRLIDYSSTKGAIVSLTRSLSLSLLKKGIRVNAVAPGPVWTPLIPASFSKKHLEEFGENVPMGRAGQPEEIAPSYVFLASDDASYISGQVIHPNGGVNING